MKRHSLFNMSTKTDCFKTVIYMKFLIPKENTGQIWANTKQFGQMVQCLFMN